MELLEFYKKKLKIDPVLPCSALITNYSALCNKLDSINILKPIYSRAISELGVYCGSRIDYFTSISGNKVIVGDDYDYTGIIDLWFPKDHFLFELENPILAGWLIEDIKTRNHLQKIESLLEFSDPTSIVNISLDNLLRVIKEQDYWGFWMGDLRNSRRKAPVKLRHLRVKELEINDYDSSVEVVLVDINTREEISLTQYNNNGWNFYLSKELLEDKLKDLETLWTRGYDNRVRGLDYSIRAKKKELENLILERKNYMNGITEYREKLKEILWKGYSTL